MYPIICTKTSKTPTWSLNYNAYFSQFDFYNLKLVMKYFFYNYMDPHPECVKTSQGPPPCKFNYYASLAQSDNYNPGIKFY